MSDDILIASLLSVYERLVRKHSLQSRQKFYRPGPKLKEQKLWKKLASVVKHCRATKVDPVKFLTAQFEQWSPTRGGEDFPSPRYIGVSKANLRRYTEWAARRRSELVATVEPIDDTSRRVIDTVVRNTPGMTSEDFYRDPLRVRLLPVAVAQRDPIFQRMRADGAYADSFSRLVLREYLND